MPRPSVVESPEYVELAERLALIESTNRRTIETAENAAKKARAKSEYEKSVAIMQGIKSGLSVYAIAKLVENKSSVFRQNLVNNCEAIIETYELGEN